ncbi:MAG: peptide-methionine (S)-S-oxide reductase [Verrucomicrobiia bacterium Tous-C4TDCM]|nr:MAG: peptide-methionine (S)-S-oxide reductase [Verrucomicrobiae bacterium Tous-C4TDCM]
MKRRHLLALLLFIPTLASCEPEKAMPADAKLPAAAPKVPEGSDVITLGAGCFWCIEAAYRQLDGVQAAVSGYMGGTVASPTYEQICEGTTGHAEVVQVVYDPKKITTEKLLTWFFDLHDPTTLNRQGADVGTQYRSAIFYHTDAQKAVAEAAKKAAGDKLEDPVVTEITKAVTFYPAENYHQDFYFQNKSNGYCRAVVQPKLKKLKLDH